MGRFLALNFLALADLVSVMSSTGGASSWRFGLLFLWGLSERGLSERGLSGLGLSERGFSDRGLSVCAAEPEFSPLAAWSPLPTNAIFNVRSTQPCSPTIC